MAIMQAKQPPQSHDSARNVYKLCRNGDKSLVFVSIIGFSENMFIHNRDDETIMAVINHTKWLSQCMS